MEWILPALLSACCLGFYDIFKKLSVKGNNVLMVLMLNTMFGVLYLSPVIISNLSSGHFGLGDTLLGHALIIIKAVIVLSSWILGYFAIKHLPLTIQGPINATRPVLVLVGALCIFGERLNLVQWAGIMIGFASLYFISRIGAKEGFSLKHSRWLWMSIGAMMLGAMSALFDKYLLRSYLPLEVQAWYSLYQCILMTLIILALMRSRHRLIRQIPLAVDHTLHRTLPHRRRSRLLPLPVNRRLNGIDRVDDTPRQRHHPVSLRRDSPA